MHGNTWRDTKPELALRSILHRRGQRFRKRYTIRLGDRRWTQPDLVFGVRAEDVRLASGSHPSAIQGSILTAEPLGDEIIYTLRVGDAQVRASTAPTMRFAPDENVAVTFNVDRIHLFDAQTQKRVL